MLWGRFAKWLRIAGSHFIFAFVPDIGLITNNNFKLETELITKF